MYKKKISAEQFLLDCINKEFEIIGSSLHWNTLNELVDWSKQPENQRWYSDNEFATIDQYNRWKSYFMEHFYNWQPKRVSKERAKQEFSWFNLQYGLKYGFDIEQLYETPN